MKNLITICVFLTLTACSGSDFQIAPPPPEDSGNEAAESGSETSNDSDVKDSGVKDSDVADSNDVSDTPVDTKEIDVCSSAYSCARSDDYACANVKGNIEASPTKTSICDSFNFYAGIPCLGGTCNIVDVSPTKCDELAKDPKFAGVKPAKCVCNSTCKSATVYLYITLTKAKAYCDTFSTMFPAGSCKLE